MKSWLSKGWLLMLGMAAGVGPSIAYVNVVFDEIARWLILLLLVLALLLSNKMLSGLRGLIAIFGLSLLIYAMVTAIWSPVPNLTISKSIMYLLVALGYSAAGAIWAANTPRKSVFNVFWPLVILALVAGIGGSVLVNSQVQMNEVVTLYRGMTFNSNFLGILILIALPLPLWWVTHPEVSRAIKRVYLIILFILTALLVNTVSRASLLAAGVMLLAYLLGLGVRRYASILAALMVAAILVPVLMPEIVDDLMMRYVYKGAVDMELLATREDTWAESVEGAERGGVFGLGYGVSYGYDFYELGLNASGYGREKANVSLAVLEEVGLVGFGLFAAMVASVLHGAVAALRKAPRREDRAILGLLIGFLLAMLTNAQFEAWLFSPGGAATPVFWATIGMVGVISREVLREHIRRYLDLRAASWASHWLPGSAGI